MAGCCSFTVYFTFSDPACFTMTTDSWPSANKSCSIQTFLYDRHFPREKWENVPPECLVGVTLVKTIDNVRQRFGKGMGNWCRRVDTVGWMKTRWIVFHLSRWESRWTAVSSVILAIRSVINGVAPTVSTKWLEGKRWNRFKSCLKMFGWVLNN